MRSFISQGTPLLRGIALALASSLLLACSSQSPTEKLLDTAKPAGSWIATLRMTGERWIANSVPESFVKATVDEARDDLGKVVDEAGKSPAPAAARLPLQRLLHAARAAGFGLEKAVKAGDRPGAARQVGRLAALQGELAAWRKQQGGGPS
jgi:3-hydroxyisobutyrate dehydrogenase-like beta-hydroxyacid dehydrogenase